MDKRLRYNGCCIDIHKEENPNGSKQEYHEFRRFTIPVHGQPRSDAQHAGVAVLQAIDIAVEMNRNGHLGIPVPDYIDENVSSKVVKIIQSYTGIVDRMVWRKY